METFGSLWNLPGFAREYTEAGMEFRCTLSTQERSGSV